LASPGIVSNAIKMVRIEKVSIKKVSEPFFTADSPGRARSAGSEKGL
jgi:hypothetical protein